MAEIWGLATEFGKYGKIRILLFCSALYYGRYEYPTIEKELEGRNVVRVFVPMGATTSTCALGFVYVKNIHAYNMYAYSMKWLVLQFTMAISHVAA